VTDEFEVGSYTINFVVEDRCGNVAKASYDFVVVNNKGTDCYMQKWIGSTISFDGYRWQWYRRYTDGNVDSFVFLTIRAVIHVDIISNFHSQLM